MWRCALVAVGWAACSVTAWANETRGWLRFSDGNRVSGHLIESAADGGRFRSDRFGEWAFRSDEATFEPLQTAAAPGPVVTAARPARTAEEAPATKPLWLPAEWSIRLGGYWQQDNGSTESDLSIDLDASWKRPREEVQLRLSTDYRVVDNEVDTNEQSGHVRWLHDISPSWISVAKLRIERSTFTPDPLPTLDYLLLHGTLGGAWRHEWSAKERTLIGLGLDRLVIDLRDYRAQLSLSATSMLFENVLQLAPRVSFNNTLSLYRWHHGDLGVDSMAEVSYAITEQLSVGLRHEYRRNAVNLELGTYSRVSLTTRIGL